MTIATARRKQEQRISRKIANRKSASDSRARKRAQLDAMAQENSILLRDSFILAFIPDPVITISTTGEITFCSKQMERVSKRKANEIIGRNIEDFITADTKKELRRMIQDVIGAHETLANGREKVKSIDAAGNGGNVSSGSDPNTICRSSDKSFPMLEVQVDTCHQDLSITDSSADKNPSHKKHESLVRTDEVDSDRPTKKSKGNVDDVMGASVTANNAGAKLSSLYHHENGAEQPPESSIQDQKPGYGLGYHASLSSLTEKQELQSSSSSSDSSLTKSKGQANSSDSGYRESNDSPEESNESSSSTMTNGEDEFKKGERCDCGTQKLLLCILFFG